MGMGYIMENTNVEVENKLQELIEAFKKYTGQDIVITSAIKGEDFSYRSQVLNRVEITVLDNKGACFEDGIGDGNRFEIAFDKMEDTYISEMNIFIDEEEEINIMFNYKGMKYSILNLM